MKTRLILAGLVLMSSAKALAWSGGGHKIVALVAYEQLDEETRNAVIVLLESHPLYDQDFRDEMPEPIRDGARKTRQQWLFAQAAIWPDKTRGSSYDRPSWHYINEPLFVTKQDQRRLQERLPKNLSIVWHEGLDPKKLNAVQAYKMSVFVIESAESSDSDKAVHLAWIFHLVGDIHQPLHASALFARGFLEKGDKGGGKISVNHAGTKLHGKWDALYGRGIILRTAITRMDGLLDNEAFVAAGLASQANMSFVDWVDESYHAAVKYAYTQDFLDNAKEHPNWHGQMLPPVTVSDSYFVKAKEVAGQRIVQAGYRLAKLLETLVR